MAGYDRQTKAGKNFLKELEELAKLRVRVGFTAAKKGQGINQEDVDAADYSDGATVAEIAAWNEFGTEHIPARPFLRDSVDKNRDRIKNNCKAVLEAVATGKKTAKEAAAIIGAIQVGQIQVEIRNGDFEANAESTIKIKGSARPLIDTGRMRQSVHYVIEEGD
jgi:hypothetical protein